MVASHCCGLHLVELQLLTLCGVLTRDEEAGRA